MATRMRNVSIRRRPVATIRRYTGRIPIRSRTMPVRTRTTPTAMAFGRTNLGLTSRTRDTIISSGATARRAAVTGGGAGLAVASGGGLANRVSGDVSGVLGDVVDTGKGLLPVAIKVVLAVIIVKIVLWLVRGRR